jgi:hypothetical protein
MKLADALTLAETASKNIRAGGGRTPQQFSTSYANAIDMLVSEVNKRVADAKEVASE